MQKGRGWLSRKLIVSLVGAVLPVINEVLMLGLPTEALVTSIVSLFGFVVGEAVVDAKRLSANAN